MGLGTGPLIAAEAGEDNPSDRPAPRPARMGFP